ncbi:MAG TPA: M56 family metallopeptidase, partial [Candidatus Angelobacter sp.]|nr:M56 family metallopeptidase [Candidatus Angelobacter sp.]
VVLPGWLLEETPAEELKYIVLHELAHLRRRDDWTNLAQQVVKAFLFFVPSVWWIERKLALEREMACDDAVLAHSGTPRGYAESLAHVAQRSFVRRQIALAQAAVSRMRQLTLRMAKILDPQRPQSGKLWKPAVPVVVVAAGLCAFSASQGPALIGFADEAPSSVATAAAHWPEAGKVVTASFAKKPSVSEPTVRAWNAALKTSETRARVVRSKHVLRKKHEEGSVPRLSIATLANPDQRPKTIAELQPPQMPQSPEYVTVREEFVMVVTQRPGSAVPESWQMHFVQFVVGPAKRPEKQVPRKI